MKNENGKTQTKDALRATKKPNTKNKENYIKVKLIKNIYIYIYTHIVCMYTRICCFH